MFLHQALEIGLHGQVSVQMQSTKPFRLLYQGTCRNKRLMPPNIVWFFSIWSWTNIFKQCTRQAETNFFVFFWETEGVTGKIDKRRASMNFSEILDLLKHTASYGRSFPLNVTREIHPKHLPGPKTLDSVCALLGNPQWQIAFRVKYPILLCSERALSDLRGISENPDRRVQVFEPLSLPALNQSALLPGSTGCDEMYPKTLERFSGGQSASGKKCGFRKIKLVLYLIFQCGRTNLIWRGFEANSLTRFCSHHWSLFGRLTGKQQASLLHAGLPFISHLK